MLYICHLLHLIKNAHVYQIFKAKITPICVLKSNFLNKIKILLEKFVKHINLKEAGDFHLNPLQTAISLLVIQYCSPEHRLDCQLVKNFKIFFSTLPLHQKMYYRITMAQIKTINHINLVLTERHIQKYTVFNPDIKKF